METICCNTLRAPDSTFHHIAGIRGPSSLCGRLPFLCLPLYQMVTFIAQLVVVPSIKVLAIKGSG